MSASATPAPSIAGLSHAAAAAAFLILLVLAFATRNALLVALYMLLALVPTSAGLRYLGDATAKERQAVVTLLGAVVLLLPFSALRSDMVPVHLFVTLVSLGSALALTRDLPTYLAASRTVLIASQAVIVIYLAFTGLDDFPLESMLPNSSSNGVTSYLVLLQAHYCILNYLINRRTCTVSALVTLGVCIVGYGRGSILAAALLLGVNVAFSAWMYRRRYPAIVVLMIAGFVGLSVTVGDEVAAFLEVNTKIGAGFDDESRAEIIGEYLSRLDPASLIVGEDYRGTAIERNYNSNPHNSYIRAHHVFGLPYLLTVLVLPLFLFWGGHSSSVKAFCGAMLMIILLRAFTEPILFPTLFDLFYFGICFALGKPQAEHLDGLAGRKA